MQEKFVQGKSGPALENTPSAILLCYPASAANDAMAEAADTLRKVLTAEKPAMHRCICDFDVPVILVDLPVPTVPGNGTAPGA